MSVESRAIPRATLYVMFSACCFGSIPVLIVFATGSGARLVDLLAWRYVIAAAIFIVLSGGASPLRRVGRRALPLLVFAGGGQAAVAFVSLSALRYIPSATLTFLFYTYPAWVAVTAALRRTEPLTGRRVIALAFSLAGIALMIGTPSSGGLHPIGVLLALASALLYATYIPVLEHLGRDLPPSVTSVFATGGAAAILVVAAVTQGGLMVRFAPIAWIMILALAVVCTVLAFIAFLRGLATIGPVRTAIVSTVEPFWAALLGTVVLGQHLGPRTLIGGMFIAAAVVLLQLGGSTRTAAAPAPVA
jgi:drug/metabolite transporter (DMT)-like permease